jgi:hypothetical protein
LLVEILIILLSEGGTIAGVLHPLEVFDFEHDAEMCLAPCVVGLAHKERSWLLNYRVLNIRRDLGCGLLHEQWTQVSFCCFLYFWSLLSLAAESYSAVAVS